MAGTEMGLIAANVIHPATPANRILLMDVYLVLQTQNWQVPALRPVFLHVVRNSTMMTISEFVGNVELSVKPAPPLRFVHRE